MPSPRGVVVVTGKRLAELADELQRERDAAVASAMEYRREREQARREERMAVHDAQKLERRAEAAEARADELQRERDELEQRWLGMRDCYDREVLRGGKAERDLEQARREADQLRGEVNDLRDRIRSLKGENSRLRAALEAFRDSYGCDEAHIDLAYDKACVALGRQTSGSGSSAAAEAVGERQGRQPDPEEIADVLVELARWSRVAERNGELHARVASALADVQAEEQTTEEVVSRMNADSGFDGRAP